MTSLKWSVCLCHSRTSADLESQGNIINFKLNRCTGQLIQGQRQQHLQLTNVVSNIQAKEIKNNSQTYSKAGFTPIREIYTVDVRNIFGDQYHSLHHERKLSPIQCSTKIPTVDDQT